MLKQRVITAVILLIVLLPALFAASPWPFALLTLVMVAAAGWEWGRLNGAASGVAIAMGILLALASGAALAVGLVEARIQPVWWLACGLWVLGGAWVLKGGPSAWPKLPRSARLLIGLVVLFVAWVALAKAKFLGTNFLLSVLALVWVADIAAYFGGRAFGKRKLAPAISPGKSWAGVYSGMLGVFVLAAVWIWADGGVTGPSPSLFSWLLHNLGFVGLPIALVFLSAMSVVGDLFESLVKRAAGFKDSSNLLPGHGGVLDRVDALLPVLPIAMALISISLH